MVSASGEHRAQRAHTNEERKRDVPRANATGQGGVTSRARARAQDAAQRTALVLVVSQKASSAQWQRATRVREARGEGWRWPRLDQQTATSSHHRGRASLPDDEREQQTRDTHTPHRHTHTQISVIVM